MSHIAQIEIEVKDLQCLVRAAQALGLEYAPDQTTYRWYGRLVGHGHVFPQGFTREDAGQCDSGVLRLARDREVPHDAQFYNPATGEWTAQGMQDLPYEIGVCRRRDGVDGYLLQWDAWGGGFGLAEKIGHDAGLLMQQYAKEVVLQEALAQGLNVQEVQTLANGDLELVLG